MIRRRIPVLSASAALAAILILAAGCADREPVGAELRPGGLRVGEVAHIIASPSAGFTLSRSAVISQAGGTIDFGVGEVVFPAGAVTKPTAISATVAPSQLAVTFSPHGLRFAPASEPELRFDLSGVVLGSELQILYVNVDGTIGEILPTTVDFSVPSATTRIRHFSTYAMGAH